MATGSFKLPITSGASEWTRPADWLPMPTVTAANDTFVGLHAVFPEGQNFAAFLFTTSAGQYRVDWGDGTVDLVNSNVQAQHEYDYATISNATLTSRGYKQAMITVTAVSGNLLTCTFQRRFTTSPIQNQAYATGFLDCILSMPNASAGTSIVFGSTTVSHRYVERFEIKTIGGCNNLTNLFSGCSSLQSVPLFDTANVTSMGQMFLSCFSLQNVPLFNTTNAINISAMFTNCISLKSVPLFNTQNVTNTSATFQSCLALKNVPLFNTANVTNMNTMFNNCQALKEVPLFDTSNVINMISVFTNCTSLQSVPLFNTSLVANMSSMFNGCFNLQSVPLFNTANVNNMSQMFLNCLSLNFIPALSTVSITPSAGTDFTNFAASAFSLDRIQMAFARTVNISNCQLSRTALVEVFNNLVSRTLTTSATITITGNWGASALTAGERLIATSKNWVIVG